MAAICAVCISLTLTGCASNRPATITQRSPAEQLYAAVAANDIYTTRQLIAEGVDVNVGKVPPLVEAAFRGHLEIAKILLDHGAMVDVENAHGVTALIWAAKHGKPKWRDC